MRLFAFIFVSLFVLATTSGCEILEETSSTRPTGNNARNSEVKKDAPTSGGSTDKESKSTESSESSGSKVSPPPSKKKR